MYCLMMFYRYRFNDTLEYKVIFKTTEEDCMKAFEEEKKNLIKHTHYDQTSRAYTWVEEKSITYTLHEVPVEI